MARLVLVVGPPAICAGSLRAWLALRRAGASFELAVWESVAKTAKAAGARAFPVRPPVLLVDEVTIWGALAIGEFAAEQVRELLPLDPIERAIARAIAHEFVNDLRDLETFLPFDLNHVFDPPGKLLRGVERDLARFLELVSVCRSRWSSAGPFLFGPFTLADAAAAPICCALANNRMPLVGEARAYVETVTNLPELVQWVQLAQKGLEAEAVGEPGRAQAEEDEPGPRTAGAASALEPRERRSDEAASRSFLKPIGTGTRRRR